VSLCASASARILLMALVQKISSDGGHSSDTLEAVDSAQGYSDLASSDSEDFSPCVTLVGTPATVSRSVPLVLRSVLKSPATACPVAQPGHLLSPMTKCVTCTELPNLIASTSSSAIGSPVSDVFYPPSLGDSSIINEGTEDDNEED